MHGWIALDAGQLTLAQPLYGQARELAAGSGDTQLGVHALTNLSMLHAELARTGPSREPARQALRLAFQARDEGRYIPVPRLHALIALQHASAASLPTWPVRAPPARTGMLRVVHESGISAGQGVTIPRMYLHRLTC